MWSDPISSGPTDIGPPNTSHARQTETPDMYEFRFFAHRRRLLYQNLQQEAAIELYWFSATGKSMYQLRSVNKNQHFFSDIWLVARIVFVLTKSMSVYSKDPKANQQGKPQNEP